MWRLPDSAQILHRFFLKNCPPKTSAQSNSARVFAQSDNKLIQASEANNFDGKVKKVSFCCTKVAGIFSIHKRKWK
jgi:hypothetical protein